MKFKDVHIGTAFDFQDTGWLGCIKLSPTKYAYCSEGHYYTTTVGNVNVSVTGVRRAYGWEITQLDPDQQALLRSIERLGITNKDHP